MHGLARDEQPLSNYTRTRSASCLFPNALGRADRLRPLLHSQPKLARLCPPSVPGTNRPD
jgi:hypothetical protein